MAVAMFASLPTATRAATSASAGARRSAAVQGASKAAFMGPAAGPASHRAGRTARRAPLRMSAAPTPPDGQAIMDDITAKWEAIEDKPRAVAIGVSGFVAFVVSVQFLSFVNHLPLVPGILKTVGLGYTTYLTYRYALFASSRKEFVEDVDSLKGDVLKTPMQAIDKLSELTASAGSAVSSVASTAKGAASSAPKAPAAAPAAAAAAPKASSGKQDFLEADPYWSKDSVPINTYRNKEPFMGKVLSVKRIVGPNATGETCDVVIEHGGKMPYYEGQSYGVIPPGINPKNGKPNSVRLYSIASSRYGDDMTGNTATLCVRRAVYTDPETGKEDPAKKGICSNLLCDSKPGDMLTMTGPSGKVMLLPEEDPKATYIMVATGTGIAPFNGFVRRLFIEKTPVAEKFQGLAWLFLGVANSDSLLYDEQFKSVKAKFPNNFRYDLALSREQKNASGGKMYIQDKVGEYADEIFALLDKGAHMYFCGLRGMMPGINEMLEEKCKAKGLDYEEFTERLKKNGQWHVEVY